MMLFRPGTALHEIALGAGIMLATSGVVMVFVLFWLPLFSYSFHYWAGK